MKLNSELKKEIEKYKEHVIIVEGKKDVAALRALNFNRVFSIHQNNISIKESAEKISQQFAKEDKVCVLTDLDKKGRKFHAQIKQILQEKGVKTDASLRKLLVKSGLSHVEGIYNFVDRD